MKKHRVLAAETALAAVLAGSIIITPAQAGIPVIDGTNRACQKFCVQGITFHQRSMCRISTLQVLASG